MVIICSTLFIFFWIIMMSNDFIDHLIYKKKWIFQNDPMLLRTQVMEDDMKKVNFLIGGDSNPRIIVYRHLRRNGFAALSNFKFKGCRTRDDFRKAFKEVGLNVTDNESIFLKKDTYSINLSKLDDTRSSQWCGTARKMYIEYHD